jgi:uncharacterized membrane protein
MASYAGAAVAVVELTGTALAAAAAGLSSQTAVALQAAASLNLWSARCVQHLRLLLQLLLGLLH